MAATGNEIVLLKQLKLFSDRMIKPALDSKLDAPESIGADGQVLVYGEHGNLWVTVPEFITKTEADEAYQRKGSYLTSVPKATSSAVGGIMVGYTESGKNYPVELDPTLKAFVNVPWTDTNTTYEVATTSTDGLMSSEDKAKLDGFMPSGITIGETEAPATGTPNTIYIQMLPVE